MKSPGQAIFFSLALLVGAAGCNIETTPSDQDADAGGDDTGRQVALTDGFYAERYGVGASWYDYDSQTHALTPRPFVYRVTSAQTDVAFRVVSYYDEEGTSGFFTLQTRPLDASTIVEFEIGDSVKEAPVCVDLETPAVVDCAEAHHVVLRTDLRVVPAAGFAVQDPWIYASTHFTSASPLTVQRAEGDSLEVLPDAWTRLPDAKSRRADSLLAGRLAALADGESSDVLVQATADMQLAAWSVTRVGDAELSFAASCEELATSEDAQTLPDVGGARRASIAVDADGASYVDLCAESGPTVVSRASEPAGALRMDVDSYDLIVERFDGQVSLRLPPGHLLWSTGRTDVAGTPDVPASLWE
ncbi:hypothetical protein FIV42_08875 [Persicimonas caeni]|uniref:Lipoprotein n=1 Tax=Persicimonas caeni TaxID=2292766 RepID=A0A4Y6PRH8_PERCE|nr:hypothetical protein [Persicimonas caeni]QDG50840.1 hypothetical protein FIV42_08875 [Persicimonas caeni]QED32061.1 hypothetical protein FRD00_08870 [Persicimonas caeni]